MLDRLFTAALAFCLLAGGTIAVGSAWFAPPLPAPSAASPAGAATGAARVAQTEASRPAPVQ